MYSAIELTGIGGDACFLALVVAFFGLCVALVRACEAIMGPDPSELHEGGALLDEPLPESDGALTPGERLGVSP